MLPRWRNRNRIFFGYYPVEQKQDFWLGKLWFGALISSRHCESVCHCGTLPGQTEQPFVHR